MVSPDNHPHLVDLRPFVAQSHPVERQFKALLAGLKHPIFFDIGANEGEDTLRYLRMFPGARVHAFEPLPENQQLLRQNLKKAGAEGVNISSFALSNQKGRSVFHVSSGTPAVRFAGENWNYGNKSSSLLPPLNEVPMHGWIRFEKQIEVETDTLDAYCNREGVETIDWMHIDVQGAERLVLEGGQRILRRTRAIWMEVMKEELYAGQTLRTEMEKWMEGLGFIPLTGEERGSEADVLFLNRRFFKTHLLRLEVTCTKLLVQAGQKIKKVGTAAASCLGLRILKKNHPFLRYLDEPPYSTLSFALHQAFPSLQGLTFLQVGANDGILCDPLNTFLDRLRWSGVRVEPHPLYFAKLQTSARKGIQLVQAAVGGQDGSLILHYLDIEDGTLPYWANGLATTDRGRIETAIAGLGVSEQRIQSLEVPCLSWSSLLHQTGVSEPDVVCLDTEGMDVELLRLWDWERHRPPVVIFEHACVSVTQRMDFYRELMERGYELATEGPDTIAYLNRINVQ